MPTLHNEKNCSNYRYSIISMLATIFQRSSVILIFGRGFSSSQCPIEWKSTSLYRQFHHKNTSQSVGMPICVNRIQYKGRAGWGLWVSGILHIPEERTPEVFIVLECDRSQKDTSVTLLWTSKIMHSTFVLGVCTMLCPKTWKRSSLVPCPSCDAGTNLHFSLTTFDFYGCTSVIPVHYIHISSKNCNSVCHVILFINSYHFLNIKLYIQAVFILHYLYILACNVWDET